MQELLIKMAKEATSNESLIASFIQTYCRNNNVTWVEVANQLNSSELQLAKLALCRQPTKQNFNKSLTQIAHYTKIELDCLMTFLQPSPSIPSTKRTMHTKSPSTKQILQTPATVKRHTMLFATALGVIMFIAVFLSSQPKDIQATLNVTAGQANITQTGNWGNKSTTTVSAGNSITLASGDVIQMATNSNAELFLFEGSQVTLEENAVLELTELLNDNNSQQIYLTLFTGRIINRVTKILGIEDAYEIRTPSSTASVRGTIFSVAVLDDTTTEVKVLEGVVDVTMGNELAHLHAGEMVTAVLGQRLNVEPINDWGAQPTVIPIPTATNEVEAENNSSEIQEQEQEKQALEEDEQEQEDGEESNNDSENTENNVAPTAKNEAGEVEETGEPVATNDGSVTPVASTASTTPSIHPNPTDVSSGSSTETPNAPNLPTNTPNPLSTTPAPKNTLPPSRTPVSPPTNTPVPPPTNTPLPPPTNTPLPPPTNTPVPPPTNTPVPPPTNTPVPPPTAEPQLVTLCHKPGNNQKTMQVPQSAVQGHLNHGDHLGACN